MNVNSPSFTQIFTIPRIMIASPASGSGKTTLTCALLRLLQNRGKKPASFKCGPDFIDPMFHERVLGVPSTNLDSYFVSESEVREIFANAITRQSDRNNESGRVQNDRKMPADCAVIEGVMGLFDGLAGKSIQASSYDIARITKTPILLVLDASGMSRSVVPIVQGFLDYDKKNSDDGENLIKGIFLNKCSKGQFDLLKPQIEEECGVKAIGFLSKDSQDVWKSRHLGLFLPSEIADLNKQIQKTADLLAETLDFTTLEKIMNGAAQLYEDFNGRSPLGEGVATDILSRTRILPEQNSCRSTGFCPPPCGQESKTSDYTDFCEGETSPNITSHFSLHTANFTVAIARDEAFCFYYQENLRALEETGAVLEYFSPLHDSVVPSGAAGILLGGGYPELHAEELQANESMRHSIRSAVKNGVAVMAECGGFLYLQERLVGGGITMRGGLIPLSERDHADLSELKSSRQSGFSYEMCGAIEGECFYTGKLVRFGYAEFTAKERWLSDAETTIKGHEFHYFDSTNNGNSFTAKKPLSSRSWDCMIFTPKMLAGFPHLYYKSCPEIVRWFVGACKKGGGAN